MRKSVFATVPRFQRTRLPMRTARWSHTGVKAAAAELPRAASTHFALRVFLVVLLVVLLFGLSDCILYNRAFANPLMVFCFGCSLTAFLVAAIFPDDGLIWRPVIVAGLLFWSLVVLRITSYEWDARVVGSYQEPVVRTMLRRWLLSGWSLFTVFTTFAYVAEHLQSSWATIRAQFAFSGAMELLHTALIHIMYCVDPDSQPKVPIAHTSGVRVGPPPFGAYAPGLYLLFTVCLLTSKTRVWLSRHMGAIALGQVRAAEMPKLPAGPSEKDDGEALSTHSSSIAPVYSPRLPCTVEQSMHSSANDPAKLLRAGEPAELATVPGCYRRRSADGGARER